MSEEAKILNRAQRKRLAKNMDYCLTPTCRKLRKLNDDGLCLGCVRTAERQLKERQKRLGILARKGIDHVMREVHRREKT